MLNFNLNFNLNFKNRELSRQIVDGRLTEFAGTSNS